MQGLRTLIDQGEDWIIHKLWTYAKERGYAAYTSTLEEAWRLSVRSLSEEISRAAAAHGRPLELQADEDLLEDPNTIFGVVEAQRHRERGVTLGMFLGLLKYYRQSYVDLVEETGLDDRDRKKYLLFLHRFFDRVEIAVSVEWARGTDEQRLEELRIANRFLTNEKNKYLTAFESGLHPTFLLDERGRIENMNRAAAVLLGGSSTPGSQYYCPFRDRSLEVAEAVADTGTEMEKSWPQPLERFLPWLNPELERFLRLEDRHTTFERDVPASDGFAVFRVNLARMLDISGKSKGALVVLEDFTDQRRTEQALRQSEERFRSLFENMAEGVALHEMLYDPEGRAYDYRIVEVNPAFEKHTGLAPDRVRGMLASELYGVAPAPFLDDYDHVARTGEPAGFEFFFEPMQKHFRVSAVSPLRGMFATVFEDVTERKYQREKLNSQRQVLDTIFQNAPYVMILVNKEGRIKEINRIGTAFVGMPREEILGLLGGEVLRCVNSFDGPGCGRKPVCTECPVRSRVTHTFETGEAIHNEEGSLTIRRDSGAITLTILVSTVLVRSDGEDMVLVTIVDITDLKRAEQERIERERQEQEARKQQSLMVMAGAVAHHFNNQLHIVLGNLDMAVDDVKPGSNQAAALLEAQKAAQRAAEMSRLMLTYVGQGKKRCKPLDLALTIRNLLPGLGAVLPRNIRMEADLPSNGDTVMMDPADVWKVLMSLVMNASDAIGKEEGVVSIAVSTARDNALHAGDSPIGPPTHNGPCVCLEVTDSGCGMDQETRRRMFDPFFSTKPMGRGMGLAEALGIVRASGGAIFVQSEPHRGTTVRVLLPANYLV